MILDDVMDAVEALEGKVGVNGSAVATSLDYTVTQHTTQITANTTAVTGAVMKQARRRVDRGPGRRRVQRRTRSSRPVRPRRSTRRSTRCIGHDGPGVHVHVLEPGTRGQELDVHAHPSRCVHPDVPRERRLGRRRRPRRTRHRRCSCSRPSTPGPPGSAPASVKRSDECPHPRCSTCSPHPVPRRGVVAARRCRVWSPGWTRPTPRRSPRRVHR